jgi:hypothetical protein
MRIEAPFVYTVAATLPGRKFPTIYPQKGVAVVELKETTSMEAPLVMSWTEQHRYEPEEAKEHEIREFEGAYYAPVWGFGVYGQAPKAPADLMYYDYYSENELHRAELNLLRGAVEKDLSKASSLGNSTEDEVRAVIEGRLSQCIIIDGAMWRRCHVPVLVVDLENKPEDHGFFQESEIVYECGEVEKAVKTCIHDEPDLYAVELSDPNVYDHILSIINEDERAMLPEIRFHRQIASSDLRILERDLYFHADLSIQETASSISERASTFIRAWVDFRDATQSLGEALADDKVTDGVVSDVFLSYASLQAIDDVAPRISVLEQVWQAKAISFDNTNSTVSPTIGIRK